MKSRISRLALFAIVAAGPLLRAQEAPSFFSFLNAIGTSDPTTLTVNGKKMGAPYATGFYTGGMGFMDRNAAVSVANGELPEKSLSVPLSPETSPIVIAYLKIEKAPPGSGAETTKSIDTVNIPCSTADKASNLRAVYVGGDSPIVIGVKSVRNRESDSGGSGTEMKLPPGVPVNVPLKGSPLRFFSGQMPIGVHDAEGNDNFLFVFYPTADGKLAMAIALDTRFE